MRGLQTRLRVLRQLFIFIVAIVCFGAILMNIDAVQQIGSGLLASAGVAGIIARLRGAKIAHYDYCWITGCSLQSDEDRRRCDR